MEFIKTNDENSLCSKAAVLFMNCIMTNPIMTQQVASFLTPFEAEDMRRVSQGWRKMINPVLFVHKIKCHKWVQPGPSNDHEMPFFFDVLESSPAYKRGDLAPDNDTGPEPWEDTSTAGKIQLKNCRAVEIRAKVSTWADQGWGKRKGRLFVRLARPCPETGKYSTVESLDLFGVAKHTSSHAQVTLSRQQKEGNHAFFDAMQDGDSLHLFRYVGNGPHSLVVIGLEVEFILAAIPNA